MRLTAKNTTAHAQIDSGIEALTIIDVLHHQIHDGNAYSYSFNTTALASSTAADGSSAYNVTLRTGAVKDAHLTWSVFAGGQVSIELYRGSSISGNGTAIVPENRQIDSNVSQMTLLSDSSSTGATGLGVQRFIGVIPGGELVGNKLVGGGGGDRDEWMLGNDATHVFVVTNQTTADILLNVGLTWYERG